MIEEHPIIQLFSHEVWKRLMYSWHRPNDQHDACEFLNYFITQVRPLISAHQWQARLQIGPCISVVDRGPGLNAIKICLTGDMCVSAMVRQWNTQVHVHAFTRPPCIFIAMIDRFAQSERGEVYKDQRLVHIDPCVHIPVFTGSDLHTAWHPYVLNAGIVHLVDTPFPGHYHCFLHKQGQYWKCDDSRTPFELSTLDNVIRSNVYLLFYIRDGHVVI